MISSHKLSHSAAQLGGAGLIGLSVVCHNGIHHFERLGIVRKKLQAVIYLVGRSKKSAVNAVKIHIEPLIMLQCRGHIIGKITHDHITETARVRGKYRRWNGTYLNAHGRKGRQYHRQRTASHSRKVMDSCHLCIAFQIKNHLITIFIQLPQRRISPLPLPFV